MAKTNQIVVQTTKAINKKGKLKGKNKKETKVLRAMCMHHKLNKHGKLKATIWNNGGDYCACYLCNKKFPASFFADDEIDKRVDDLIELNDQNKFTAIATNAGDDTVKYLANTSVTLSKYSKVSKKLKKLASKQSNVKKKNKNRNGRNVASSMYGSWGTAKR